MAELAEAKVAVQEGTDCLRVIQGALEDAQARITAEASQYKIPDVELARRLGVSWGTVRRWREEFERWLEDQEEGRNM